MLDWNNKVKRILKSELIKRGVSTEELTILLNKNGCSETKSSVDSKISRGTFSASFFMQCLYVIGCAKLEIEEFALELLNLNPGKRIEILLTQDITIEIKEEVKLALQQFQEPKTNHKVNDVAIINIQEEPFDLNISPQEQKKETDAVIGVARAIYSEEQKSLAIVRLCITDSRAKRLLYAESHHFNKEHTNILVMDVSSVTGGMKKWIEIIGRCFQPNQNRRFGAVIFFSEGFYVDKINIEQSWKQLTNKHAYNKVPSKLLEMIITD